jgi:5-methylcytosine-specific restriction endonuclease McrA
MSEAWTKGSTTRWRIYRAEILRRDHYLCQIGSPGCTTQAPLVGGHVDHITPLSLGGQKYDRANCRASCSNCNLTRKRAKPVEEPTPKKVSSW